MRVEDVMTIDVMIVTPETPLKEAARMLVGRGVSGSVRSELDWSEDDA